MILGVDEAGRGPWAGPLVVGVVVLGGVQIDGLTDSKKLSKKKREALYIDVTDRALAYASGWVTARELDEIGMSEALRLATRRAVEQISVAYSEIIIDGTINFLSDTGKGKYVQTMPKADLLIPSVSAASIIAKVERDRYMDILDEKHPEYGFRSHAGYGVAKHRAAIEEFGVISEHRLSFAPLIKYLPLAAGPVVESAPDFRSITNAKSGATPLDATRLSQTKKLPTKAIGDAAETVAADFLMAAGHTIVERNWRTKFCEIDIVSQKGDRVYFVEVKYRKNDKAGDGLAMITPKKLKQMHFAARVYKHGHQFDDTDLQLAAVAVTGQPPQVTDYVEIV